MKANQVSRVVRQSNLTEYFREALDEAANNQRLSADDHTKFYVVNLLTAFTRSEELFEPHPDGPRLKPLALMLTDALSARHPGERGHHLRRLGDIALFMSGFFPDLLARQLVDVDYYIAMGGQAYESLHTTLRGSARGAALSDIYAELASKFAAFVDALDEVAESMRQESDLDILRLYEIWMKTGSQRCAGKLRRLGVEANDSPGLARRH